ncbi:MAG: hypothetical protein JOZ41_08920 [Chloroflexi bacterium]|nr:hypothetical protein [Chloroflexota bacterium]
MISKSDLDTDVLAIGELMGLVTRSGDAVSINTDWFGNPIDKLATIDRRLDRLVAVLGSFLGPAAQKPPDVFPGAQWYPLPNPETGGATAFHLVMPDATASSGQIGLGVLHPFAVGNLTIQAFLYVPLFSYSPSGAKRIAGSRSDPCRLGLNVTTSDRFKAEGASFKAMRIEADVYLADQAPSFTLAFEDLKGSGAPATYHTLQSLLDPVVAPVVASWIGEVIVQGSYWLHLYLGSSPYTVGQILTAAHFLTEDKETGEYHLSLDNLKGQSPTQIALNLAFAALDALSTLEIPLISLPGGGIFIARRQSDNASAYGLRFAADLSLSPSPRTGGKAPPAVDLCLGTWLSGESDKGNWVGRIMGGTPAAGLSLFVLERKDGTLSFAPSFQLTSVGFTIKGGGDAPLIDLGGYTLRGAEIRTYLDSADWTYGFAVRLDEVGFPLGPSFQHAQAGSAGSNVVVQNLLASGSQDAGAGQASAVNPSFSATAAYIRGHPPLLEMYDPQGQKTDVIWFPVQRRFGPINCQKVGLRLEVGATDPILGVVFDGGVSLAVLEVYLDQLSVNAHLKRVAQPSGYEFDLHGLDLKFTSPSVKVSGGLLKVVDASGAVSYDGEALITFNQLALSAVGSYSSLPDKGGTSLFIFALLNGPIGGPAFCRITGIAAGFGYNRALKLPAQTDVKSFPLVAAMADTSLIGGDNPSPGTVLSHLRDWVPPEPGSYWLAAGLQFTTFEIIKTNALLIVEFGKEFVIAVLGLATLRQPQTGDAYVYAELEVEVVFSPQAGEIKASAVLSPGSYVLTRDAHLTGGFAFYAWFGDPQRVQHAGDFVFTMGGYHPAFTIPAHYPREPRVGVNWQISDKLAMVGNAYLAITPAAMMAGAGLQLTFDGGPLKAWLKVQADAILFWKPFYLVADASVSVGVSLRLDFLCIHATLSVELAAEFHLWGPPMGGEVHINLYIISFTIGFGAPKQLPSEISWDDFKAMLPSKTEKQQTPPAPSPMRMATEALAVAREAAAAAITTETTTTPVYLSIRVNQGLKTTHALDGLTLWLVRADQFELSVDSAIPASQIVVESEKAADNKTIPGTRVGIRRVHGDIGPDAYRSTQTVTILQLKSDKSDKQDHILDHIKACMATSSPCTGRPEACTDPRIKVDTWDVQAVQKKLPQAMWGDPVPANQVPAINAPDATVTATAGVTMSPRERPVTNCTPQMGIDQVFADRTVNRDDGYRLPLSQAQQPPGTAPVAADSFKEIAHVNDKDLAHVDDKKGPQSRRTALFVALQNLGVNGWTNEALPKMAETPGRAFADEPMEGAPVAGPAR